MLGDRAELKRRELRIERDSAASQAPHREEIYEESQGVAVVQEDSAFRSHAETVKETSSCPPPSRHLMASPAAPSPWLHEIAEGVVERHSCR
jgi:hypothetical protein